MQALTKRIREFNNGSIPALVRLKYRLMKENAFRFFRGTCHLFYQDLSKSRAIPPTPLTWNCGDLHIENFGSYRGDNHLVYFDLNDFDEAILAPASWEVARMVTSILVAFNSLKIDEQKALNMATLFLKVYSDTLSSGKARYIEPQVAKGIVCTFLKTVSARTQQQMLKKRTETKKKKVALTVDSRRHLALEKNLKEALLARVQDWLKYNDQSPYNYEVLDVVFRIAGTGSVGLNRYAFLLQCTNNRKDYLLLDMKQARQSSLYPYVNLPQPEWNSEAHRIITIQNRMQNIPPALLSTIDFQGHDYTIQEMQPSEDKIDFKLIKNRYKDIYQVISDMALLTASAQLRTSGHQGAAVADELIAFGKNNQWQQTILDYAIRYANKVRSDFSNYRKAHKEKYFE